MPNLDAQTRDLILAHLDGELTLDDLRRRFMPLAWRLDEFSSIYDPVTARTSLYLAEFSRGHRGEGELADLLASLLARVRLSYGQAPFSLKTSVATTTQSVRWPQLVVADR